MKRISALVLSFLMILGFFPAQVFASQPVTVEIVLETDSFAENDTVTAKVYADSDRINAVGYSIEYDSDKAIYTGSDEQGDLLVARELSDKDAGILARSFYLRANGNLKATDGKVLVDIITFKMLGDGSIDIAFKVLEGDADFGSGSVFAVNEGEYLDTVEKVTYTVTLASVREEALNELSEYKNPENHSQAQQEEMAEYLEKVNETIASAATIGEVEEILKNAKKELDKFEEMPLVAGMAGGEEIVFAEYDAKPEGMIAFHGVLDELTDITITSRKTINRATDASGVKVVYTQNSDGTATFTKDELRKIILDDEEFEEYKNNRLNEDFLLAGTQSDVIAIDLKDNKNRNFAYLVLEVPQLVVDSITLDRQTAEIETGESVRLNATTVPSDSPVTWKSSNESVAVVIGGVVTGRKAGTATITASSGGKSATCTVTVKEPAVIDTTADIYLSISHDDKFIETPYGEVMALKQMSVPYFDLDLYGLGRYHFVSESYDQGGEVGGDIGSTSYEVYDGKVTILHAMIWATEVYYFGLDPEDAGKGWLFTNDTKVNYIGSEVFDPTGSAGSMYIKQLWGMDENFNYYYNYAYPLASEGWGSTADQILLRDGDIVTIGHFTDWSFHLDDLSVFNFIKSGDKIISTTADKGEVVEFTVMLAAKGGNYTTSHLPMEGRGVYIKPVDEMTNTTTQWDYAGETDEDGNVLVDTKYLEPGKYVIGTPGHRGKDLESICSTPGAMYLTVTDKEHTHTSGDWTVTEEPTCAEYGTKTRYCESCSYYETDTVEPAHKKETIPGKEATCTQTGLTEGEKCAYCGEIYVEQEVIAKKPHTEETMSAKAATCSEAGLTEGKKCSVCGEILEAQKETEKLAHKPVVIGKIEATCEKDGYTGDTKCEVCGNKLAAGKVVDKLAHTEVVVEGKAATYTESGLTDGKKCSVCGEILVKQEVIQMLEKAYTFGDIDGDGTVTAKDATQILRYINGKTSAFTAEGADEALLIKAADVDGDGEVTAKDATQILRHINGKTSVFDKMY